MLERSDFEAKLFRDAKQHQDFILTVAVRVHVAFSFQHFDKRFEAQIAARRDKVFFASSNALVVLIPRFLVIPRFAERPANRFFDSHARGGIPPGLSRYAEVRALRIFAQRELDAG